MNTSPPDARRYSPSAARNIPHIIAAIAELAPNASTALEIASGSGQHAIAVTDARPSLNWQPTDVDRDQLASIEAWRLHAPRPNLAAARFFDASATAWTGPPVDLCFVANLLHLISEQAARAVVATMVRALGPGGQVLIYGPFLRADGFASDGDRNFDAQIRANTPEAGYKTEQDVAGWLAEDGLSDPIRREMPANNLILGARQSSDTGG